MMNNLRLGQADGYRLRLRVIFAISVSRDLNEFSTKWDVVCILTSLTIMDFCCSCSLMRICNNYSPGSCKIGYIKYRGGSRFLTRGGFDPSSTSRVAASRFYLAILRAAKRRADFFCCYFTSRDSGEPIFLGYFEPP